MKNLLKAEEIGMLLLSVFMFALTDFAWWWFPALLLLPDLSMVGYLFNSRSGALLYNFFHHKGIAILFYMVGYTTGEPYLALTGSVLFGHASMDRIFGFGLKYADSFKRTHLGHIGLK